MIIYFSASGNSKYVANRLAAACGDEALSITECVLSKNLQFTLKENEDLGFVTPTYFRSLPDVVVRFLCNAHFQTNGSHYVYHVQTFGAKTGTQQRAFAKLLHRHGLPLHARYSVKMVDTWTPLYDLTDKEKNQRQCEAAEPQIEAVIDHIQRRDRGNFNHQKGSPIMGFIGNRVYSSIRETRFLNFTDECVRCGLCEQICPDRVLALIDEEETPVVLASKCSMCLACVHRCPQFAIHYENASAQRGQFVHPRSGYPDEDQGMLEELRELAAAETAAAETPALPAAE